MFAMIVVVVILAVIGSNAQSSSRQRNKAFQELARQYRGRFVAGGLFGFPRVYFNVQGIQATVQIVSTRQRHPKYQLQVQFPWSNTALKLHVAISRNWFRRMQLGAWDSPLPTGDQQFDEKHTVNGAPPGDAQQFLSAGVRLQIQRAGRLSGRLGFALDVENGVLAILAGHVPQNLSQLQAFVNDCLALYEQALLAQTDGIEFVDEAIEAQPIEEAICQICGEAIHDDMVFCSTCKTPHHLECWHYNQGCSTYACPGTEYLVPKVARPIAEE